MLTERMSELSMLIDARIVLIASLTVSYFVCVEHRQQLSIEGNETRSDQVRCINQLLNYLQRRTHDFDVLRVQCILNRDDELRDNRVDFVAAIREQILNALPCEGLVRMLSLRKAVEKQRQIKTVIKLVDVDCPTYFIAAN